MDITPILESVTPLGLLALMIVLGYYAINKLSSVLERHYERQQLILNQILLEMTKCAEELDTIKESFQKADKT